MPTSSGIMFLMYKLDRLMVLVYIRQPHQHRGGAKRWAGALYQDLGNSDPMREAGASSTTGSHRDSQPVLFHGVRHGVHGVVPEHRGNHVRTTRAFTLLMSIGIPLENTKRPEPHTVGLWGNSDPMREAGEPSTGKVLAHPQCARPTGDSHVRTTGTAILLISIRFLLEKQR